MCPQCAWHVVWCNLMRHGTSWPRCQVPLCTQLLCPVDAPLDAPLFLAPCTWHHTTCLGTSWLKCLVPLHTPFLYPFLHALVTPPVYPQCEGTWHIPAEMPQWQGSVVSTTAFALKGHRTINPPASMEVLVLGCTGPFYGCSHVSKKFPFESKNWSKIQQRTLWCFMSNDCPALQHMLWFVASIGWKKRYKIWNGVPLIYMMHTWPAVGRTPNAITAKWKVVQCPITFRSQLASTWAEHRVQPNCKRYVRDIWTQAASPVIQFRNRKVKGQKEPFPGNQRALRG